MKPIRVGFLGAGLATQAIHLPAMQKTDGAFRVVTIMDVDRDIADAVAARCDARSTVNEREVYGDDSIEVVVICSPNQFHAEQAIACCGAGRRLVLCEKPLALTVDDGLRIATAAAESGTAIVVGAMHTFDPAVRRSLRAWDESGDAGRLVRSSIYLPSNDRFVRDATDPCVQERPRSEAGPRPPSTAESRMRGAILGLAIHDLPILRRLAPSPGEVRHARFVEPLGYAISASDGECITDLRAFMPGVWDGHWTITAIGHDTELSISFPPSYVLAGSATAIFRQNSKEEIFRTSESGYEAMWQEVRNICRQDATAPHPDDLVDDLRLAVALADQSAELMTAAL